MSSIDTRVVEAKFDNRQFQEGVKGTLSSLDSLKRGLNLDGATQGLNGMSTAVNKVSHGFSVLRVAAYTAVATVAHQLTIAGEQLVKSFTVGPLIDGLHEYETQLNSVQTILSNTQWEHKNLQDVNGALNELNHYSDKTIYNFSEMARNVGTFTAAGVKLDTSVAAIKGIANLAAVSGSNSQQASTAMYQLSQAISSGTVKLMDWNSVVNAGMGGKVFQDALKETARVHNVNIDAMIKKEGSFRNTLQNGWLTSKILTQTLNNFTGDVSKKQLEQMGYTEKQITGILKMGKVATDAATKVKTFTQLMGTLKEAAGSGWAKTWQLIIGNFNQAKKLWTNVSNVLGGAIQNSAKARNTLLKDWAAIGGRAHMIDAIKNAFEALMSVLKPIGEAFREVFPRKTSFDLLAMTDAVRDFFARLKIGVDAADNLKRTFAGLFALLDIGWQVIKAGIHFIADLFGAITKGEGSGGFLAATANIGDWLVALDQAIKKGQGLTKFFDGLMHVLSGPIALLKHLASALFGVFDFGGAKASPEKITKAFSPLETFGHTLVAIWDKLTSVLGRVWGFIQPLGTKIAQAFSGIGEAFTKAFGSLNYDAILHTINTALLGGIVLLVKKFVDRFTKGSGAESPFKGFVDSIKAPFGELTNTLQQMQNTLRATTLLQIAAAIGIITASVIGLSHINAAELTKALTAMSVMFGQLFAATWVFQKIGGAAGLASTAAGLILFATAIRVLTSSVKALAALSWNDLVKGLIGVTALIGGLVVAVRGMSGETGGMIRAGAGLLLLAAGIKVLASAVGDLADLSWGEMSKGLVGVGILLASLAIFTKLVETNKAGVLQGAGLVLLATGIKILASAVSDFADIGWGGITKGLLSIGAILAAFAAFSKGVGNPVKLLASGVALIAIATAMNILAKAVESFAKMSWGQIVKGLVAMAGALAIIVVALSSMESAISGAAALLIVAGALRVLAPVLTTFGEMAWGSIAKAMVTLTGALAIILLGVAGMTEALPGAAALLVVAAALRVLTPVLVTLGGMSWEAIAKGLVTLAAAFAIIGLAAAVLTPLIPSMLGLGAAIALLGVGVLAIGAGVFFFAAGLTALAAAGAAGVGAIVGIVKGLIDLLPLVAKAIGMAIVAFAKAIASAGPAVLRAITVVLDSLIKAVDKEAPKLIKLIVKMMSDWLDAMVKMIPRIADAGLKIILGVLRAIEENAPKIVRVIARTMVDVLHAIAQKTDDLVAAGIDLIVAVLHGIARKVDDVISAGVDIVIKLMKGIAKAVPRLVRSAINMMVDMLNGVADAIRGGEPRLITAFLNVGKAIIDGFIQGIKEHAPSLKQAVEQLAKDFVLSPFKAIAGIFSPSKVFHSFGIDIVNGLVIGINESAPKAAKAITDMGKGMANGYAGMSKEFRVASKFVLNDLVAGLVGGRDEVKQTVDNASNVLHAAVQKSRDDMKSLNDDIKTLTQSRKDDDKAVRDATEGVGNAQKKLNELQNAKKQDHEANVQAARDLRDAKEKLDEAKKARREHQQAIEDDTAALKKATDEHNRAKAAFDSFNASMDAHKAKLIELGKQYDEYTAKIDAAKQALDAAISTEQSYNDSIVQQYSALPDISADTTVEDYTGALTDQVDNTATFITDLNTLRDQFNLSDELYKELLSKGPAILPFVEQLLSGGQAAVDQLNLLTAELDSEATALGATASASLYQAGVDAAQGLLNGLKKDQGKIEKQMEHIANIIAKAIRKALKIKSPSQVMHEIGQFVGEGLVNGMASMEGDIDKQGKKLVDKMNKYIQQLNALLSQAEALTPTIAPVLDLSGVQKDVAKMKAIVAAPISVDTAFSQASQAASGVQRTNTVLPDVSAQRSSSTVTLIQNNNSPKALSAAEIYRQTSNQLSLAKGALANAS